MSVAASSARAPQSGPGGARPGDACPLCGAFLRPQQEWCLRCGAAARTRLAASPNWRLPLAVIAAVAALSLGVLAAALVKLAGDSSPARSQATTIAPATSAATAPAATAPATTAPATTAPGAAATQPTTAQPGAASTQPGAATAQPGSTATAGGSATAPSSGLNPRATTTSTAPATRTAPASR